MESYTNLHPIQLDQSTGELYLQLSDPHSSIKLTPPRPEDVEVYPSILNDPKVYSFLAVIPHPYQREDGIEFNTRSCELAAQLVEQLKTGKDQYLDGCPFTAIREVLPDGTDVLLGSVGIHRDDPTSPWLHGREPDNPTKPAGDPTIIWSMGDYLASSHHGRGIMTAVVKTLMTQYAIPRLNCKNMLATPFVGNEGSMKVFLKNGFRYIEDVPDAIAIPESRGGEKKTVHVLHWVSDD